MEVSKISNIEIIDGKVVLPDGTVLDKAQLIKVRLPETGVKQRRRRFVNGSFMNDQQEADMRYEEEMGIA